MWHITSNNIQRAKDELQLRRSEIETRHAEEQNALDAEFAVIQELERAASEFMLRHNRENDANSPEPTVPTESPSGDEEDSGGAMVAEASQSAAPIDMPSGGEIGSDVEGFVAQPAAESEPVGSIGSNGEISGSLDILKPGSRWRLYRGNRTTDPDDSPRDTSPTTG